MITTLFAFQSLIADGWRSNCQLGLDAGCILLINAGAVAKPGDVRHAGRLRARKPALH